VVQIPRIAVSSTQKSTRSSYSTSAAPESLHRAQISRTTRHGTLSRTLNVSGSYFKLKSGTSLADRGSVMSHYPWATTQPKLVLGFDTFAGICTGTPRSRQVSRLARHLYLAQERTAILLPGRCLPPFPRSLVGHFSVFVSSTTSNIVLGMSISRPFQKQSGGIL